jgi:uncharacterized membrane protein
VTRRRTEWAPAAVTAVAMIATPLARRGGPTRRALASVVVTGLCATTGAATNRLWGPRRTAGALGAIAVGTGLVERIGTATGVPFGGYAYTGRLRPHIGGVPVIVPLAWFAMAVPAREAAHAALADHSTPARRIIGGAAALTAWDLFLDPQMVGEGYWGWQRRGRYRGIPASNFLGWFLTALGVMAVLEMALPVGDRQAADGASPDAVLVGEYATMAVMETLGFAAFFKDRVVAAVGGTAMLPIAAAAVRGLRLARNRHG